jgi:DNA-binding NarL/FixJ family response regulator
MNKTISIVLADDHPVVRDGLRRILEANNYASIVGEASTGDEALEMIKTLKPTIAIIDVVMPGINGVELTRMLKKEQPDTHIIVLSMYPQESYVLGTLRNGADGYVLKDSGVQEIMLAIQTVLEGKRYLSPRISQTAIEAYIDSSHRASLEPYDTLTDRERQVMALSVQGLTSREVGEKLGISSRTVETHRENLMRKMKVSSLPQLISYALQKGILPPMYHP